MAWTPSPISGVDRKMLDRIGDETARATTIVRNAPESGFAPHVHSGGEEFLVLDGVFSDEQGDFPAGSYVRNPPQSSHTPSSAHGCTIFVKLWQFELSDRTHIRTDTSRLRYLPDPDRGGVTVASLYRDSREDVVMERWERGSSIEPAADDGLEILVVEGGFRESGETFRPQSWLRLPAGARAQLNAGGNGAHVWIKPGHLKETPAAPVTG